MYFLYNVVALTLCNGALKQLLKSHHWPCWIKREGTWSCLSLRDNTLVDQLSKDSKHYWSEKKQKTSILTTRCSCAFRAELHHFWSSGPTPAETQLQFLVGGISLIANPSTAKISFLPFVFRARSFRSTTTWEGERGHRGWTCVHPSGLCPPAAWAITARQGFFSTLNSDPSRSESFSLLRDTKQL